MEYRILGALEVLDGGATVTPTAPKILRTLAMLLVNHNRTVSRSTMIDEIWPVDPPVTAVMTLNTYIYQLRRILGLGSSREAGALLTKPGGYELIIAPESLDLGVFDSAVAMGRCEFAAGQLTEASSQLRSALRLRRGPVLSGLEKGPLLSGITARVEEDTLDATELRVEIDIRLGRHREVIGELRALIAQYGVNEDLYSLLMLALYRSDRRWEALKAYDELRRSLRKQFGIDPSQRLQRLHQNLLSDAPCLLGDLEIESVAGSRDRCRPERHAIQLR